MTTDIDDVNFDDAGDEQTRPHRESRAELQQRIAEGWRIEQQAGGTIVLVKGGKTNRILHGILTLISLGLWIPVWFIAERRNRERRMTLAL